MKTVRAIDLNYKIIKGVDADVWNTILPYTTTSCSQDV